jgi:putative transcriptional regulator
MAIRNKLKDFRFENRMNQGEFAEYLGILQQQYNRYEKNNVQPNLETALKIAKKLNVPVEDIFEMTPN